MKHVKFSGCARCGGEGHELDFKQFDQPVVVGEMVFEHWALCPTSGDPILLLTIETDDDA